MKLLKLLTATAVGAMITISVAAADTMEIHFNDKIFEVDATIVSDRTMISTSSLEKFGISAAETDGFWEFSKHGNTVRYDSNAETYQGIDGEFDIMPMAIEGKQLMPLRTLAENLGLAVGWDEYERKVVLIDMKDYYEELRQTAPEFYKFLNVKMKEPTLGVGSCDLMLSVVAEDADEPFTFKLKVVQNTTVADGLSENGIIFEEFLYESEEGRFALEDLTVDGIYDIDERIIYFKTNAVEKLSAFIPEEQKAQVLPVLNMFSAEVWYKFDYGEYVENMLYSEELSALTTKIYEGITMGELFDEYMPAQYYVDDIYAFEYITELYEGFKHMTNCGILRTESVGSNTEKIIMEADADKMLDLALLIGEYEYELTDEEIAVAQAEFVEIFGENFKVFCEMEIVDSVPQKTTMEVNAGVEGSNVDFTLNQTFDVNATPEQITTPTSALNIMSLVETIAKYSQGM